MNITIIAVGKVKEKFYRDAIAEYSKRLSKYCKISLVEVSDEPTPDNCSDLVSEQIKAKEAERILKCIKAQSYVFTLEILGEEFDSVELSKKIEHLGISGKSDLTFVIGGSLGLHNSVIKRANAHISFSKLTFPHQLMRVILFEQIYRSFRIMNNEPYHK